MVLTNLESRSNDFTLIFIIILRQSFVIYNYTIVIYCGSLYLQMYKILLLAAVLVVTSARPGIDLDQEWNLFKEDHGKSYTAEEETLR